MQQRDVIINEFKQVFGERLPEYTESSHSSQNLENKSDSFVSSGGDSTSSLDEDQLLGGKGNDKDKSKKDKKMLKTDKGAEKDVDFFAEEQVQKRIDRAINYFDDVNKGEKDASNLM